MDLDRVGFARDVHSASLPALNSAIWGAGLKHVYLVGRLFSALLLGMPSSPSHALGRRAQRLGVMSDCWVVGLYRASPQGVGAASAVLVGGFALGGVGALRLGYCIPRICTC